MAGSHSLKQSISIDVNAVSGQSIDEEKVQRNFEELQRHVFKIDPLPTKTHGVQNIQNKPGTLVKTSPTARKLTGQLDEAVSQKKANIVETTPIDCYGSTPEELFPNYPPTSVHVMNPPLSTAYSEGSGVQALIRDGGEGKLQHSSLNPVVKSPLESSVFRRGDSVDDEDLFGAGETNAKTDLADCVVSELTKINEMEELPLQPSSADLPDFAGLGFENLVSVTENNTDITAGANDVIEGNNSESAEAHDDGFHDEGIDSVVEPEDTVPNVGAAKPAVAYRSKRSISDTRSRRNLFSHRSDIELFGDDLLDEIVHSPEELENYRRSNSLPDVISSSSLKSGSDASNQSPSPDVTHCSSSGESGSLEQLHQKKSLKDDFEGHSSLTGKSALKRMVSFKDDVQEISNNENIDNPEDQADKRSPSQRRQKYSETSSGYQTGSDAGSQDRKFQSQSSQGAASDVSSAWTSAEDEGHRNTEVVALGTFEETACVNESAEESNSENSQSGSSFNTVISTGDKQNCELPSSEFGRLRIEPGSDSAKCIRTNTEVAQSKSYQASGRGNLPIILHGIDSSFTLGPSMIKKVDDEENRHLMNIQQKYTNVSSSSTEGATGHETLSGKYSLSQPKSEIPLEEIVLRQYLEERLVDEKFSPSQLIPIMTAGHSDSSTPGFSPAVFEQRPTSGKRLSPDLISFTQQDLEQSSRCYLPNCQESYCLKLKTVFRILSLTLPHVDPSYDLVKSYCLALFYHAYDCCELACPVVFCPLVAKWLQGTSETPFTSLTAQELISSAVQTLVKQPITEVVGNKYKQLIRLQTDVDPPEDYVTLVPLACLGNFGSAILCQNLSGFLCVVKKHPLFEESHQLSVYSGLARTRHPYIVTQFWLLEYEDSIQVCTLFMQGGSLRSHLELTTSLSWEMTLFYMRQILTAVTYLHQHLGIIYLYWKSDNMLFPSCSRNEVKLSNFSLSVPLGKWWDKGSVKESLPANICPPELSLHNTVSVKSDTWGAGCLMAEMLSGQPVCHKLRHCHRDEVLAQVRKYRLKVEGVPHNQLTLLQTYCWKNEDQRRTCEQLEDKLENLARNLLPAS